MLSPTLTGLDVRLVAPRARRQRLQRHPGRSDAAGSPCSCTVTICAPLILHNVRRSPYMGFVFHTGIATCYPYR